MSLGLTDSHTHLDAEAFNADRDQVIERALAAGVSTIVTIGANEGLTSARTSIELVERHAFIYASVGIHPCDGRSQESPDALIELAKHPRVVAIGETGLDHYWDKSFKQEQEQWFRLQITIAKTIGKPLIIHSRSAGAECLKILKEENASQVGGVFHCYAEDVAFAKELRDINFLVSFPGALTFKNAEATRKVAAEIPLEQIMLETDAPFLAPEPFRGKRCETAHILETAKCLAKIRGISLEELARITSETARKFYKLEKSV